MFQFISEFDFKATPVWLIEVDACCGHRFWQVGLAGGVGLRFVVGVAVVCAVAFVFVHSGRGIAQVQRHGVGGVRADVGKGGFHRFVAGVNIPSEQFAAYWVGRLRVPETGMYQIKGKLSWANVRVMLDRHIILDAKNSLNSKTFRLKKGEYLLEVEYENHWHTTKFHLNIVPVPILRSP